MRSPNLLAAFLTVSLAACATLPTEKQSSNLPALASAALCENGMAAISIAHPTARIDDCVVGSKTHFNFIIRPENTPINNSAWYGFRVDPKQAGTLRVNINYEDGKHRYRPKISYDGTTWTALPESRVRQDHENHVEMRLKLDDRAFFVSAQEIFTKESHDNWTAEIASQSYVSLSEIGTSHDGHPISMLEIKTDPNVQKPYVMWVGRQHPPEVTGALALIPFTETVLGDSELAKRFRDNFNVLIVPNMNPDGVTAGNWRHNKGGIDLNRDWGPFTQPETQAVKSALAPFENGDERMTFFLDFHSTSRNLLYTQADEEPTSPPMFAHNWITAVDDRLDDNVYAFTREARHNSGKPISKNYMYDSFGISAITYEVGDETDRKAIKISAAVFAEEMMRLLLEAES
ncbi:MAG: M14 family zinc carboxypeptidase [Maricaulaceae bacterium]